MRAGLVEALDGDAFRNLMDEWHARHAFSYAVQEMHDVAAGDEETMRVAEFAKPIDDEVTVFHVKARFSDGLWKSATSRGIRNEGVFASEYSAREAVAIILSYLLRYNPKADKLVSTIVPSADGAMDLKHLLSLVFERSTCRTFEFVVDNGSREPGAREFLRRWPGRNARSCGIPNDIPFN